MRTKQLFSHFPKDEFTATKNSFNGGHAMKRLLGVVSFKNTQNIKSHAPEG